MKELDSPALDEQVIAVPKISLDRVPKRFRRLRTRKADQLVEVPTIISYSSLPQRNVEQTIDIPVPHDHGGRGGGGGLQIFSQGQGTTACRGAEFVDIPVPQGRGGLGGGGLQSFSQEQGSTAVFGADLVDNPVPHGRVGGGGLQGSLPGQGSAASSSRSGLADEAGQGVFRTFPGEKSAGLGPHSGSELGADFNPSTLSAHQMPPEQLVDVPVPLVHESSSYDQETRLLLESLHRRREAEEAARLALVEEEQMEEDEEEERVEVSRFLPHFRPRRWCWYVHAGSICPRGWNCTFAHHESELHPDSW